MINFVETMTLKEKIKEVLPNMFFYGVTPEKLAGSLGVEWEDTSVILMPKVLNVDGELRRSEMRLYMLFSHNEIVQMVYFKDGAFDNTMLYEDWFEFVVTQACSYRALLQVTPEWRPVLVDPIYTIVRDYIGLSEVASENLEAGSPPYDDLIPTTDFEQKKLEILFPVARALYWVCTEYHEGQDSDGYEALSIISQIFKPSPLDHGIEDDDDEIYITLVDTIREFETIEDGQKLLLQWANWVKEPPKLNDLLATKEWQIHEESISSNLAVDDPERYGRVMQYMEQGMDGNMRCEQIEDYRDFVSGCDYPDWVRDLIYAEIDGVEKWHENNGTLNDIVG